MVLVASIVVAYQAKPVYCATWTMHAHQILAIPMQFVTQVRSMDHTHAHVQLDTKVLIALKTSMNAIKDHHVNTMAFV